MDQEQNKYQSIGCSYYDQLEAFAVKRTRCTIKYNKDAGEKTIDGIITDVYSKDGAEYLSLDNGTVIRLDHLISVNGILVRYVC